MNNENYEKDWLDELYETKKKIASQYKGIKEFVQGMICYQANRSTPIRGGDQTLFAPNH